MYVIQPPQVQEMKLKKDLRETSGFSYFRPLKRQEKYGWGGDSEKSTSKKC